MRKSGMTLLITSLTTAMALSFSPHLAKALYVSVDEPIEINIELYNPVMRFYFVDASWWNKAEAESWAYMWKDGTDNSQKLDWPGEIMTHVIWDATSGTNTWSISIDLAQYDRLIISRRKGVDDWGAQTVNITLTDAFNTITLTDTETWGSDPGAAVTTSLETYE